MSCKKMAAGQQRKRLRASNAVGCNLQQYSAKKAKIVESSPTLLSLRPHISLEWDDTERKVVAKREQIGLAWGDLRPFTDCFPKCYKGLADVLPIPQETFGLEDMAEVLSYEVWNTHLSDTEKEFLTQFLPERTDAEQVVQKLLSGENLYFGNPFLKWGASLCSGNLHPDAILGQELWFEVNKKAYNSEQLKYHDDILENSLKWKERYANCEDLEKMIDPKIWSSSKKHTDNSISSHESESSDPVGTAKYCSRVAIHKVCKGNKQHTLKKDGGGVPYDRKVSVKDKRGNSSVHLERPKVETRFRKEEKPRRLYVRSGATAKYMSYIKISKQQHALVKEMKQSGDGIQSKSLHHVLGNIKHFSVKPYEAYEEEVSNKLHKHWLQLANRDLPLAFTHWIERKLERQQLRRSLEQEISEKKKIVVFEDEEKENPDSLFEESAETYDEVAVDGQNCENDEVSVDGQDREDDEVAVDGQNCEDDEDSDPLYIQNQHPPLLRIPSLNRPYELSHLNKEESNSEPEGASPPKILGNINHSEKIVGRAAPTLNAGELVCHSTNTDPFQRNLSLNGHLKLDHMDMEMEEGRQDLMQAAASTSLTEFVRNLNPVEVAVHQQIPITSSKEWSSVGLLDSYYHQGLTSAELSLGQPTPIREPMAPPINLESDTLQNNSVKMLFQRPSNGMGSAFDIDNGGSVFGSYINHDRDDLQPFPTEQGVLSHYSHQHRQPEIQFLTTRDGSLESATRQPLHFQEQQQHQQQHLSDQRQQIRDSDLYMDQAIHNNFYSSRVGHPHSHSSQRISPPVNVQNWPAVNPVRVSAPLQNPLNGGFLDKNWYSDEQGAGNGWSGVDISSIPGQCLGNRGIADQSLYSILSQGNKIQPHSNDSVGANGQYILTRNFMGGGIPGNSDFLPHTSHHLNYLNGREAMGTATATTPALRPNNSSSWMSSPHQSSGLHDSIQKPFLRSWNS